MISNVSNTRYNKQILLKEIGEEGQIKLQSSSVVIVGCGALGSHISNALVRAGVGKITIVDRDLIDEDNLQRQILFDENDIACSLPKAVAAANKLKLINSNVSIYPIVADLTAYNIKEIFKDTDLIFDGTDNFEARFLINDFSIKNRIPWIYGGVVSTNCMCMAIIPNETACLMCLMEEVPLPGSFPTCNTVGVLNTAVSLAASLEVTEGLKILLSKKECIIKKLIHVNVWNGSWQLLEVKKNESCSVCTKGEYEFITKRRGLNFVSLCSKKAMQLTPSDEVISFQELAKRLQTLGSVTYNEYLLQFYLPDYEIIVFRDGRTLIKSIKDNDTLDETHARSIFAKYIGS